MTARPETDERQRWLENAAVELVAERFPGTHARPIDSLIVLRTADKVICLSLKASPRPLTRQRLAQHAKMRRLGYVVRTCKSVMDVSMALPRRSSAAE